MTGFPRAVLFDLLTALLHSWTAWNAAAGSEARGRAWRAEYLRLTYGCGAYQPYEHLVLAAADATGLPRSAADALERAGRTCRCGAARRLRSTRCRDGPGSPS
jgi:2-haloacid dehalogenase